MAGSLEKHNMSQIAALFSADFESHRQNFRHSPWQQLNLQQLIDTGLPCSKDENWKYTSLEPLQQTALFEDKRRVFDKVKLAQLTLDIDAYTTVFVDGYFNPTLSDSDLGLWQMSLIDVDKIHGEPAIKADVFAALTEGLAKQQVTFHLPDNCYESKPLYAIHINTSYCGGMEFYYHNITMGNNSQGKVIEHHLSIDNTEQAKDLYGSRLIIRVGNNSQLEHVNFISHHDQTQHFSHNDVWLGREANVHSYSFLLSGGLIRHNTSANMQYKNAHIVINSLSLPVNLENYDSRTFLIHQAEHCDSVQLHKNIVQDQAIAVFNGLIKVSADALKTDGVMNNHNLLLSDKAQMHSKPQLEIYADDVKCSHGCTTGALNKEQLFYLMTRGINKKKALRTLVYAFAIEVFEQISVERLNQSIYRLIEKKLKVR
jgi:Fe-S cluster assembly protein SufD